MSNLSHSTGAGLYWFTVTKDLGCEFGDSGGAANSYRLNALISGTKAQFERVVEANDGVKITDLPSSYLLGTDATGLVQSTGLTRGQTVLTSTVALPANTDTTLADLNAVPGSAGTYLITVQVVTNHNGNYTFTATLRDQGAGVGISHAKTSGNGFVTLTLTAIYTAASAPSFRVACLSSHTSTIQVETGDGTFPTDDLATHLSWVRLA
jgi:hypothetical protein